MILDPIFLLLNEVQNKDRKSHKAHVIGFTFEKVDINTGNGKNPGYENFVNFLKYYQNLSSSWSLIHRIF